MKIDTGIRTYIEDNFTRKNCDSCTYNFNGKCVGLNDPLYGVNVSEIMGCSLNKFPCVGYKIDFDIFCQYLNALKKGIKPRFDSRYKQFWR